MHRQFLWVSVLNVYVSFGLFLPKAFFKVWWRGGLARSCNKVKTHRLTSCILFITFNIIVVLERTVYSVSGRVDCTSNKLNYVLHQTTDVQYFLRGSWSKLVHTRQRPHPLQLDPRGYIQCQRGLRSCHFLLPLPARQQPAQIRHPASAQLPHWHIC